jgi:5-methylcytosine-specific restriction endonuclease McrA
LVTTRQLAEKVIELYWPHTVQFAARAVILRQNINGQAEIITAITSFRSRPGRDASAPYWQSRHEAPDEYELLIRDVEWKLIEMPLPRLQVMGDTPREFIYAIGWDKTITRRTVSRYQAGEAGAFDNRVSFVAGVGEYLLQLSGLLRSLIQRRWADMVAEVNALQQSHLDDFLFGADRVRTARVRPGIWEIQGKRCFYCEEPVRNPEDGEVDHFLPWARYPDDGLDNLVLADKRCNGAKSASLAASAHVARWALRFVSADTLHGQLADLAVQRSWDRDPERSRGAARGIYLRLPDDARLWLRGKEFVPPDPTLIGPSLA